MDETEVAERVREANRKSRIGWYGENAPKWRDVFKANLKGMLIDSCWQEGELEEFCLTHFKLGETEMRELAGLPFINPAGSPPKGGKREKIPLEPHEKLVCRPEAIEVHKNENGPPPDPPRGMSEPTISEQLFQKKKQAGLSSTERVRAYRERMKNKGGK